MEAESVAFLQDDARRLTPDFDDEGFGHGTVSLEAEVSVANPTWCRRHVMAMAEAVEPAASDRRTLACGINMAMRFSTLAIRPSEEDNDTSMTSAIVREGT
jgi:hypothetical protein